MCIGVGFKFIYGFVFCIGMIFGDVIDDYVGFLMRMVFEVVICFDVIVGYDGIDDRFFGVVKYGLFSFIIFFFKFFSF